METHHEMIWRNMSGTLKSFRRYRVQITNLKECEWLPTISKWLQGSHEQSRMNYAPSLTVASLPVSFDQLFNLQPQQILLINRHNQLESNTLWRLRLDVKAECNRVDNWTNQQHRLSDVKGRKPFPRLFKGFLLQVLRCFRRLSSLAFVGGGGSRGRGNEYKRCLVPQWDADNFTVGDRRIYSLWEVAEMPKKS